MVLELNKKVSLQDIYNSIKKRDKSDKNRGKKEGKLLKTKDSLLINTTHLSIKSGFLKVRKIIDRKLNIYGRKHRTK